MALHDPCVLDDLLARVKPVSDERVPLTAATGRVLADPVRADRDSPACDVSAVDGYALPGGAGGLPAWLEAVQAGQRPAPLVVAFDVPAGAPAPALPPGVCARVMTGAPVPAGTYAMVPREQTDESGAQTIRLLAPERIGPGDNIRRQGENLRAGDVALQRGAAIHPAAAASLSLLGVTQPQVFRRLNLTVLVTGDEVLPVEAKAQPWQVRDANGPALQALLAPLPWIERIALQSVRDDPAILAQAVHLALTHSDALLLTGGVSAGDLDFVPCTLAAAGCDILFHKLAIRPGKPLLGAVTADGRPVFGLPGNPVAVMTTARRFALPALRARAGFTHPSPGAPRVTIQNPDNKTLDLTWFRPVRLTAGGHAELLPTQGSGDPIGAAQGDGFVEVPSGRNASGAFAFFPW